MLVEAIRWQNGMVMCFDERGQQIHDLQGRYEEVREKVLAAATEQTAFAHAQWRADGFTSLPREQW